MKSHLNDTQEKQHLLGPKLPFLQNVLSSEWGEEMQSLPFETFPLHPNWPASSSLIGLPEASQTIIYGRAALVFFQRMSAGPGADMCLTLFCS